MHVYSIITITILFKYGITRFLLNYEHVPKIFKLLFIQFNRNQTIENQFKFYILLLILRLYTTIN